MQGRLSPIEKGKIQAFPWQTWREEFAGAKAHAFPRMEWVVEQERMAENPLMSAAGRQEISRLRNEYGIAVTSVTCDTFIQEPFYKAAGADQARLVAEFKALVSACGELGIDRIVVPLVDKGSIQTPDERDALLRGMEAATPLLKAGRAMVVFESDYAPARLADFIGGFDAACFGVNYDIGNSASLGFDHAEELAAYGGRIHNVHIKDRELGGTTVPLGTGDADLPGVLRGLESIGYAGNYILQTARAADGGHAAALCSYRDKALAWLEGTEVGAREN